MTDEGPKTGATETGAAPSGNVPAPDMPIPLSETASRRLMRAILAGLVAVILVTGFLVEVHRVSLTRGLAQLETAMRATAQARAVGLSSEIARQRAVAAILARDRDVIEGLRTPDPARAQNLSMKFEGLLGSAGSSVLYLVEGGGETIAASNWRAADSFVASNYGFRAYFMAAMRAGAGQEYALGSVSHRPGLYLSERVQKDDRPLGAVIVKVEFDGLETSWREGGGRTAVVDDDGHVTLTSEPELRFQTEPTFGPDRLVVRQPVAGIGWHLVMAQPTRDVARQAMANTVLAGLSLLPLVFLGGLMLRRRRRAQEQAAAERRYREDLEQEVAARTYELSGEIREREAAEQRLAAMQAGLVQANRLATLGQVTAGVAHEVNQPLATIRLLAENAQAMLAHDGSVSAVDQNLTQIVKMSERIETITAELRGFSRKARGDYGPVPLAEAWEASLLLSASRRVVDRVRLSGPRIPAGLRVMAEKVRLEQVLVNLLQNAHEALQEVSRPRIDVSLRRWRDDTGQDGIGQDWATLTIADNGPGLAPEVAENLFSPFLTTKREGVGLGLVISQGIMRDFGGRLHVDPPVPGQGARFHVDMKVAP